ncbi:MAG: ATP-binding cassette domain-containing protein [Bacteroidia bacterium]|nr:ATP-binding cassette domain-containing protein [Bacteroidia bacterium]MDW8089328.1 ATP-binding cassette domain-containing protein [Bacteroidia bacterium]
MRLSVQRLSKRYGRQWALREVSFTLEGPGVYGYLGPNGAGKSTTFKILTGYLAPTEGRVTLDDWQLPQDKKIIQRLIGYLPEHNPLYAELYVREYLAFRGALYNLKGRALTQRIDELIEKVGLAPEAHKRIGLLSRGYRQRVGLAAALLHDPPLLILDEPTSGLDPNQAIEIRQLIRQLGRSHIVIFSSHILSEVEAIADRVLILHKGELVLDAPLHALPQHLNAEEYWVETAETGFQWDFLKDKAHVEALSPTLWVIRGEISKELQKEIYAASVAQRIPLLRLERRTLPLQEVFHQLTREA